MLRRFMDGVAVVSVTGGEACGLEEVERGKTKGRVSGNGSGGLRK